MIINIDFIYPVGSIYISMNSVNPSILFGGTWEQISQGRCLIGAGQLEQNNNTNLGTLGVNELAWTWSAGTTLGEVYHTLNISEMPPHKHDLTQSGNVNGGGGISALSVGPHQATNSLVSSTGGGLGHNNIQPSLVAYMWQRIA